MTSENLKIGKLAFTLPASNCQKLLVNRFNFNSSYFEVKFFIKGFFAMKRERSFLLSVVKMRGHF